MPNFLELAGAPDADSQQPPPKTVRKKNFLELSGGGGKDDPYAAALGVSPQQAVDPYAAAFGVTSPSTNPGSLTSGASSAGNGRPRNQIDNSPPTVELAPGTNLADARQQLAAIPDYRQRIAAIAAFDAKYPGGGASTTPGGEIIASSAPSAMSASDPYAHALGLPQPANPYATAFGIPPNGTASPVVSAQTSPPQGLTEASLPSSMGSMGDTANFLARTGANVGNQIYGGLKGLGVLATGGGTDAAADATRSAPIPVPAATMGASQLEKTLGYVQAPLNWAGDWAQRGTEDSGVAGAGAMGAIAKAALVNLPMLLGAGPKAAGAGSLEEAFAAQKAAKAGAGSLEDAFAARNAAKAAKTPAARIDPTLTEAPYNPVHLDLGPLGVGDATPATAFTPPTSADAPAALQQAIADAKAQGQKIDPTVVGRHVAAQTLPVPVQLTKGQATMDPTLISNEMNGRGAGQAAIVSPEFYNAQGKALAANVDAIQAKVAPDIADTGKTALGQTVVDAYKTMDAPIQADITAKYQALRDANGGQFPVDAPTLMDNIKTSLGKELLTGDAPASQMSALQGLADSGSMSMEQFLSLRRNLGNVARTSADGNTRMAASKMIEQMEALPLTDGAADLKPLADDARSAARNRFQAIEADPAYKAAVNDPTPIGEPSPLADRFTDGYVINGRYANVKQMRANLAADPTANQAIASAQLENLRGLAKADPITGTFNQAAYNKGLQAAGPKLAETLGPEGAYYAQTVGDTAKLAQAQPRGAFVNNSNTFVAGLGNKVATTAEKMGNAAVPFFELGTEARNALARRATAKASAASTQPGAGMTSLSDIARQSRVSARSLPTAGQRNDD